MQTLNDALYQLYMAREVVRDECLRVSADPNEFLRMIGEPPLTDETDPRMQQQQQQSRDPRMAGAGMKR
jgi:twitching motility protein PilT